MTVRSGYSYGYGPADGRARMRTSTVDREHAVALLKDAFTEGRLTKDEYDERVGRALTARTFSDLDALVIDLPVPPPAAPARRPRTNALAVASLACGATVFFTAGLTALPAVVLGHTARHQIRRSGEHGAGVALAGLVMGWAVLLLTALLFVIYVAHGAGLAHASVHFARGAGYVPAPAPPGTG